MNAILLTAVLAAQPPASPAGDRDPAASIEGQWTVICFEKNGQPMAEAKDAKVTVRNNTITFDGKEKMKTMRIQFQPMGTVRVTETDAAAGATPGTNEAARPGGAGTGGESKKGVYVLTQDYLAVCLHDETDRAPGSRPGDAGGSTPNAGTADGPTAKTYCTVILRRSGPAGGTGTDRK